MANLLSRRVAYLLLFGALAQSLNATVNVTMVNNTVTAIVNPTVIYGTLAQFPGAGGGSIITCTGTVPPNGGTLGCAPITDYNFQDFPPGSYIYRWGRAPNSSPVIYSQGYSVETAPGNYTYTFGAAAPTCRRTIPLVNNTIRMIRGYWRMNGNIIYTADIMPGATVEKTLSPPDCNTYTLDAYTVNLMLNDNFELVPSTNILDAINNTNDSGVDSTNTVTQNFFPPRPISGPAAATGAAAPVTFSTAAGTNTATAIQEGLGGVITSQQQYSQAELELLARIQENTLATRTNTTAVIPSTASMQSSAGAANSYSNSIAGTTVGLSTTIGGSIPAMTVSIGGQSIDLNPFNLPGISSFCAGIRLFILWLSSVMFVLAVIASARTYLGPLLLAPQASAASATPALSSGSALVMAALIVAILGAVSVALATYAATSSFFTAAMSTPFGGGTVGTAALLLDNLVPVQHLLSLLVAYLVFQFVAAALVTGAALAVRFFVGCFALVVFSLPASAVDIKVSNLVGTNITVGSYVMPPGSYFVDLPAGSYTVTTPSGTATATVPSSSLEFANVTISDNGAATVLTTATVDVTEMFWLGMSTGAICWSLGWFRKLLHGVTRGGAE